MNISDATFIVVDTETTGKDATDHQVVEVAAVAMSLELNGPVGMWSTLVRPTRPIPSAASAIHGITAGDVDNSPSISRAMCEFFEFGNRISSDRGYVVAMHNAEFDQAFLGLANIPVLCTLRLAKHFWPLGTLNGAGEPLESRSNGALRYWRGLTPETFGIAAHRALGDAIVTAALLRDQLTCEEFVDLGITGVDELVAYAESPVDVPSWPFGKFYEKPIEAADSGYIRWALKDAERVKNDRDLKFSLEQELRRRQDAA